MGSSKQAPKMKKGGFTMGNLAAMETAAYQMAGEGSMAHRQMGTRSGYGGYETAGKQGILPKEAQEEYNTMKGLLKPEKKNKGGTTRRIVGRPTGTNRPGSLLSEKTKLG